MKTHTDAEVAAMDVAFKKVQNKEHWKFPIDKTLELSADEQRLTEDAIIFYTGSVPTFQKLPNGKTRVRAVGYYNAVGA